MLSVLTSAKLRTHWTARTRDMWADGQGSVYNCVRLIARAVDN